MLKLLEENVDFKKAVIALMEGKIIQITTGFRNYYKFTDKLLFANDTMNWISIYRSNSPFLDIFLGENQEKVTFNVYKEKDWWENIPEKGILCYVSDHKSKIKEFNELALILRNEDDSFYSSGLEWRYAIPLSKEEIKELFPVN